MTKPTIVTRAGKGSALTWTEGDANLTNLRDATISVTDGTNIKALNLNDTLTFTAGTNITLSVNASTGAVTINNSQTAFDPASPGAIGGTTAAAGTFTGITAKGANNTQKLLLDSTAISTSSWGFGPGLYIQSAAYTNTSSSGTVSGQHTNSILGGTFNSTNTTTITEAGALYISPPSAGTNTTFTNVYSIVATGRIKASDFTGTIGATTPSSGAFTTLTATSSTSLQPTGVATVTIAPAAITGSIDRMFIGATTPSTGKFTTLTVTNDIREAVFSIGTTVSGTITPDANNGTIQTFTITGNTTLNAFSNPVSGQTITFIITQGSTGGFTLTSTMKFAGASKTLSTAIGAVDILTVSYIGTTYYASLSKGFA